MSELKVETRVMKLADLKPAEYNPRKITEEAFHGLGQSLKRFGVMSYIVWNKRTGNIVGGHQRFKQLVELGEEETEVVVVDLDDSEEVALNITLNNRVIKGDFTKEVMDDLRMSEAQLGSAFLDIGLFDLYEELRRAGLDDIPKPPKEKKIKEPREVSEPSVVNDEVEEPDEVQVSRPQAVITCPKCKSQWRLTDNYVVFNSVTMTGERVGDGDVEK